MYFLINACILFRSHSISSMDTMIVYIHPSKSCTVGAQFVDLFSIIIVNGANGIKTGYCTYVLKYNS